MMNLTSKLESLKNSYIKNVAQRDSILKTIDNYDKLIEGYDNEIEICDSIRVIA